MPVGGDVVGRKAQAGRRPFGARRVTPRERLRGGQLGTHDLAVLLHQLDDDEPGRLLELER